MSKAVEHALPAHETRKLASLVKGGMSVDEGLRLIAGGKVETENVVVFACKKCKTPYHVDWEGRAARMKNTCRTLHGCFREPHSRLNMQLRFLT